MGALTGTAYFRYFILSALLRAAFYSVFLFSRPQSGQQKTIHGSTQTALKAVSKLTLLLLAVMMIFTAWKVLTTSVGSPAAAAALSVLTEGPYSFNFWTIEILVGMVIPFVLILASRGRNLTVMFIAAVMMIFSLFFTRLDMVVVGQIVPQYFEVGVVEYSKLHTYSPSIHEILVVWEG
jgi:molybdopterin-containing oxidoreductase family membrane subunit